MERARRWTVIVAVLALATGPIVAVGGPTVADENPVVDGERPDTGGDSPTIDRIYPNPIAGGDAGEFVVVSIPADASVRNATLSDGTTTVSLPNHSTAGRVAITRDPNATAELTDVPVANGSGLALANGGETLTVRVNGETASQVRYADAPEGEIGVVDDSGLQWRPLGATDFDVATAGAGDVRAFVLPDNPAVPTEVLRGADRQLLVGGYTLSSERVATILIDAKRRGVDVRVLLEGAPVGGRTQTEARQLDRLVDAGVDVYMVAGQHARVDYHHAKYAVADDRAVVMTENWKPAGTGGNSSRGWGVVTGQRAIVANLTATFEADANWRDAVPWREFRRGKSFERGGRSLGGYPSNFDAESVHVNRTELLVTPDNAGGRLVEILDDADDSISVVQASLGDWDDRLPTALRRAAQRDVEVRVLLSSAWYSREENQKTVDRFREWADRNGATLDVELADPAGRFEKIHAKGAIVDGEQVVLGSLNWNDAAMTSNREILLVLHGAAVSDYYGDVFDADWTGGTGPSLPLGLLLGVLGCICLAGAVLAKIRFERDEGPVGVGPPTGGE